MAIIVLEVLSLMLKTYTNKVRTFSFYMGNIDKPRPVLGILIDFLVLLIGIFSLLYLWLVYRTKTPLLALMVSLLVTALLGYALYLKKRSSYKNNRNRIRRLIAREYMANKLSLLSRQEFEWQIIRALSSLKELANLEQAKGYLKALYNGAPVAIGYSQTPPKGHDTYEKVWSFYNSFRSRGYSGLIYISSGYFEEACNGIQDMDLDVPITLFDIDDLLDLMEQANMGPNEELLDDLVQQKIRQYRKKLNRDKEKIPAHNRFKKYAASSLLFLGASFLFRSYFPYYFVLAILFMVLGLISQLLSSDRAAQ
jgi:hypothetical protein